MFYSRNNNDIMQICATKYKTKRTIALCVLAIFLYTTFVSFLNISFLSVETHSDNKRDFPKGPPPLRNIQLTENDQNDIDELSEEVADKVAVKLQQPAIWHRLRKNQQWNCDNVERNQDPNFVQAERPFWDSLDSQFIETRQNIWRQYIAGIPEHPPSKYQFSGRGIVTLAGNSDTYLRALNLIKMVKHFGCNLPIEVWYLKGEMNDTMLETITNLGGTPRCASGDSSLPAPVEKDPENDRNFEAKTAIILNSRFREILYMDSDNIPLKNVESLFERPAYKAAGAVFWPDFWKTSSANPIWEIMDVPCRDQWEQESGQILVDKHRHWRPLNLANFITKGSAFYFHLLNGDKDAFRFGFLALNTVVAWPSRYMATVGINLGNDTFCGHTMMQPDIPTYEELMGYLGPDAKITFEPTKANVDFLLTGNEKRRPSYLFLHANLIKYFAHVTIKEKVWTTIKRYKMDTVAQLLPSFSMKYYPCTDFSALPEENMNVITEDFEDFHPNFNELYYSLGGLGGSRTQEPPPDDFEFAPYQMFPQFQNNFNEEEDDGYDIR